MVIDLKIASLFLNERIGKPRGANRTRIIDRKKLHQAVVPKPHGIKFSSRREIETTGESAGAGPQTFNAA